MTTAMRSSCAISIHALREEGDLGITDDTDAS